MFVSKKTYEAAEAQHSRAIQGFEREIEYLTKEVTYWREKAESERRRADRLHDRMLLMTGQPSVTDVVRAEEFEEEQRTKDARDQQLAELHEIYSESMEEHSDIEIPEDMKEEVAEMVATR